MLAQLRKKTQPLDVAATGAWVCAATLVVAGGRSGRPTTAARVGYLVGMAASATTVIAYGSRMNYLATVGFRTGWSACEQAYEVSSESSRG